MQIIRLITCVTSFIVINPLQLSVPHMELRELVTLKVKIIRALMG